MFRRPKFGIPTGVYPEPQSVRAQRKGDGHMRRCGVAGPADGGRRRLRAGRRCVLAPSAVKRSRSLYTGVATRGHPQSHQWG
jgi:hypothetical protein